MAERDQAQRQVKDLDIQLRDCHAERETLKSEHLDSKQLIDQLNNSLTTFQHSLQAKEQEIQRLQLDLGSQKSQISELQDSLIQASKSQKESQKTQEIIQNLKDSLAQANKLIDAKNKFIQELEAELYKRQDMNKQLRFDLESAEDKIKLLENALREFTSSSKGNYDDSYEAVLRSEFELMRVKYEKQVASLKQEIKDTQLKAQIESRNLKNEIEALKVAKDQVTDRLAVLRLQK